MIHQPPQNAPEKPMADSIIPAADRQRRQRNIDLAMAAFDDSMKKIKSRPKEVKTPDVYQSWKAGLQPSATGQKET